MGDSKHEVAYYHPDQSSAETRKELEMGCVRLGIQFEQGHRAKRCYYRKMGVIVGASDGQETDYIYAEHAMSGQVHGRPITERELRKRGVKT